jgi:hypothetical protein
MPFPHRSGAKLRITRGKLLIFMTTLPMAIAIVVIFFLINNDLHSPACANRQELLCWMVYKDLNKHSVEDRLIIANRLEEECSKGLDWQSISVTLDEAQQDQVWNNISLILRPWFAEKAKSYVKLSAEQRQDFIDRLIDVITVWRGIEKLLPSRMQSSINKKGSSGMTNLLSKEIEQLQEESNHPDREQIAELWAALQVRWLIRNLTASSSS